MSDLILNGKVIRPQDGDIIIIYHDKPDEIQEAVWAWAASVPYADFSVTIVEPGSDIGQLSAERLSELGLVKRRKPRKPRPNKREA
jgi:hypothetical protein